MTLTFTPQRSKLASYMMYNFFINNVSGARNATNAFHSSQVTAPMYVFLTFAFNANISII